MKRKILTLALISTVLFSQCVLADDNISNNSTVTSKNDVGISPQYAHIDDWICSVTKSGSDKFAIGSRAYMDNSSVIYKLTVIVTNSSGSQVFYDIKNGTGDLLYANTTKSLPSGTYSIKFTLTTTYKGKTEVNTETLYKTI